MEASEKIVSEGQVALGTLKDLGKVTVIPVEPGSGEEDLWDSLVREHHSLGYKRLPGRRIKYIAWVGTQPVAALSFSGSAPKIEVRDRWMGWSPEEKKLHRSRLVNNSRFLILPGIRIKNLASHVLGQALRRLPGDWEERFDFAPWVVESFVDPAHYSGASYRASGFLRLGQTKGFSRKGRVEYSYHGQVKDIYVVVLDPEFRVKGGFLPKPAPSPRRRSRAVEDPKPAPYQPLVTRPAGPPQRIVLPTSYHVAPDLLSPGEELGEEDLDVLTAELRVFHQDFAPVFSRQNNADHSRCYTLGLLSNLGRKSIEPIALELSGTGGVRNLQRFISDYSWEESLMKEIHQKKLAQEIGAPDPETSMFTLDSSEFAKKGTESVGVARQYCGTRGKVDNCQSGVFLGYVGPQAHGLIDARLYMPEEWFGSEFEERRKKTGVPDSLTFATKLEIASELLNKTTDAGLFKARWVGVDAFFGSSRSFLESLPKDLYYMASVRANTRVLTEEPSWVLPESPGQGRKPTKPVLSETPVTVEALARSVVWTEVIRPSDSFGVERVFVARLKVWRVPETSEDPPASPETLFLFRTEAQHEAQTTKYVLTNAPESVSLETLVTVSKLRWSIERSFLECKSLLGMDHYEHRSFKGWHRHMLHVFIAHAFLQKIRLKFKKKLSDPPSGLPPGRGGSPAPVFFRGRWADDPFLLPA